MRSLFFSYDGSAPTLEDWRRFFTVRLRARRWAKVVRDRKRRGWRKPIGYFQQAELRRQIWEHQKAKGYASPVPGWVEEYHSKQSRSFGLGQNPYANVSPLQYAQQHSLANAYNSAYNGYGNAAVNPFANLFGVG